MHARKLTAAVVIVGLALTVLAGARVAATQRQGVEARLLVDAVTYAGAIQSELERHVGAAYALRDLFDDGPVVTRAQYDRAIEALGIEAFPALHGLNVVRPVEPDEVAAFVWAKRAGGYPDYAVGPPQDATASRWLISLVAPYETNGHLLGRDIRHVPALVPPFGRARDLGQPSLGPVVADDDDDRSGVDARVGLAVPVYAVGAPTDTVEERREHLVAWVVSTVRTSALVAGFATAHDLEIMVFDDAPGAGTPIRRAGVSDGDHTVTAERSFDVFGRRWRVRTAPGPGYSTGVERYAAGGAVALGLLLTAAAAALVHVLGQRSTHAHRLVQARTSELADANDRLSAVNGELALRLKELKQHTAVDDLVQRATRQVSDAPDVPDALERLRVVLQEVAVFDRVGFSVRTDGRRMRVQAVAGPAAPAAPAGVEYVASERLWASFTTRDLVIVRDTAAGGDGTIERVMAERGIRGVITLPLVARGKVAGILTLASSYPLRLPPREVQLLTRVADGIAGPIVTLLGLDAERRAAEQLRHLDELKDEFLGVVAHDLKGPLTVVTGYTDLLLAECDTGTLQPDLVRDALTAMQRAAANQERLIADLLESQRLALGVAVPACAPIVVSDLVRETVRDLASGTLARVAFEDRSEGATASADRAWLRRVVTNLVTNAWKYGSPTIDILVTRPAGTDAVRVAVTDHGGGIPETDLPRLFQRFTRLDGERTAARSGTGLGLYICKQLVEAHGGAVGVASVVGEGSTFWFEVPAIGVDAVLQI